MLILYTLSAQERVDRDAYAERLIARIVKGESAAMGELYELLKTDVFAFALSKTAHKQNAEDISHDAFVQIWKNAARYEPRGKPLAWIFTIEMNLIRRRFTQISHTVPLDEAIGTEETEDFTEQVIQRELLRTLLRTLSEEEREIVTLHAVSGLKHREIAALLGKPLSTVLSRYNRAIKRLQAKIQVKEER